MNLPRRRRDTKTQGKSDREMTRFNLSISPSLRLSVYSSLWLCVSVAGLICLIASAAAHDLFLKFDSFILEPNTKTTARLMI